MLILLFVAFLVYSTGRFVLCFTLCYFVLVFFSPFSITITSLGEERANLSAFPTFVRFVHVWFCRFPLLLGVCEGLRYVIVALPGLSSYPFFFAIFFLKSVTYSACHLFIVWLLNCTSVFPFGVRGLMWI